MKYAKILAVFGLLALLGAGSATLLEIYGTISGTADIQPALKVTAAGNLSNENKTYVNMTNKASQDIKVSRIEISDKGDSWDSLTGEVHSVPSGNTTVVTSDEVLTDTVEDWFGSDVVHLKTEGSSAIGSGLNQDSDTVSIKIDGTVVDSYSYGDAK